MGNSTHYYVCHIARSIWLCFTTLIVPLILLALGACGQESPAQPTERRKPPHLVEVAGVRTDNLGHTSTHNGTLRARRTARIFTQEAGRIMTLPFYEGDTVVQGALLATLDDALLRADLAKATALRNQAEVNLKRSDDLSKRKMASADELARARTDVAVAQAEETRLLTRLSYTTLRAPFAGVISERLAEPSDVVSANTHILTLADPQSLITELAISELVLPHLSIGDAVRVRIDALGATIFPGRISRIHPTLNPSNRNGVVEVTLEPVPAGARAGQFCRVTLQTQALGRRVIPFRALQRDRDGEFVYLVTPDGTAKRSPVRSGLRLADQVEILEGLAEDDRVIVKGFLNLRDDKQVEIVNREVNRS